MTFWEAWTLQAGPQPPLPPHLPPFPSSCKTPPGAWPSADSLYGMQAACPTTSASPIQAQVCYQCQGGPAFHAAFHAASIGGKASTGGTALIAFAMSREDLQEAYTEGWLCALHGVGCDHEKVDSVDSPCWRAALLLEGMHGRKLPAPPSHSFPREFAQARALALAPSALRACRTLCVALLQWTAKGGALEVH
eukprot:scaffold11178_cov23-Tisochrysis_lutea.AAC.4